MAKQTVKLSIDQESASAAQMTSDEAAKLSEILQSQADAAAKLTDTKRDGRVNMEMGEGRIVVTVSKVKIEKDELPAE